MTDTTPEQADWCAKHAKGPVDDVLDVGINHGTSTVLWIERFPEAQIIGIDILPSEDGVERATWAAGDRFRFVHGDSQYVIEILNERFDFIYIDTAHDRLTTFRELVVAWGRLRYGGVLCGHDYYYTGPAQRPGWNGGVKEAVDAFAHYMGVKVDTNRDLDPSTGVFAIVKKYPE
jgi:predicted O-methyltransferase YrrM